MLLPLTNLFLLNDHRSIIQSVSLESGVLLGSYTGHTNLVTSIVHSKSTNDLFRSANGKEEIAISTSLDGTILVWDVVRIDLLFGLKYSVELLCRLHLKPLQNMTLAVLLWELHFNQKL